MQVYKENIMNKLDLFAYQVIGRIEWAVDAYSKKDINEITALKSIKKDIVQFNQMKKQLRNWQTLQ